MPNGKRRELAAYRISRATDTINAAQDLFDDGFYRDSINRSYYGIFHSLRAVLALDGIDFKKHSAVISYFQKEYVKTGLFDITISKYVIDAFEIRNESDYKDFFIASKTDAMTQLEHAKDVSSAVGKFIETKRSEAESICD